MGEQGTLSNNASFCLFLVRATPIIHKVRLCSPQQIHALFRLLLFCGKQLLCLDRDGGGIRWTSPFRLLFCLWLLSALLLILPVILHNTFLFCSFIAAIATSYSGAMTCRVRHLSVS